MTNSTADLTMLRVLNEAFLAILQSRYWMQIEAGDVIPGTNEAEVLLISTKLALRDSHCNLADFKYLKPHVLRSHAPIHLQTVPTVTDTAAARNSSMGDGTNSTPMSGTVSLSASVTGAANELPPRRS